MQNPNSIAIEAALTTLKATITEAGTSIDLALADLNEGRLNGAIGAILPLERDLPEAMALLSAILIIHRKKAA